MKHLAIFVTLFLLPLTVLAVDLDKGKATFEGRCSSCHGATGLGDGPIAASFPADTKPRNLQEANFKVATDDDKMKGVIKSGGAAHGLSPLMPPHSDLNDSDLDDVVAYIRSLKK